MCERAIGLVSGHAREYGSEWEAIVSIAGKFGCSTETLRKWVRQAQIDESSGLMRRLCVLLAVPTLCLGCSAGRTVGTPATHACVNVPVGIGALALPNGHTINVKVGRIIYIELVEPAKYSSPSSPPGFPWQAPASSNPEVLEQQSLCATKSLPPGTLALRVSAFKALRRGTARIVAPLAPAWRVLKPSRRQGLRSYEAIVHV